MCVMPEPEIGTPTRSVYSGLDSAEMKAVNEIVCGKFYSIFTEGINTPKAFVEFTIECHNRSLSMLAGNTRGKLEGTPSLYYRDGFPYAVELHATLNSSRRTETVIVNMLMSKTIVCGTLIAHDSKLNSVTRQFVGKAIASREHTVKVRRDVEKVSDHDFAPFVPGPWNSARPNNGFVFSSNMFREMLDMTTNI